MLVDTLIYTTRNGLYAARLEYKDYFGTESSLVIPGEQSLTILTEVIGGVLETIEEESDLLELAENHSDLLAMDLVEDE